MILAEASVLSRELNWNIVVQYIVGGSVLIAAIGGVWDRVRKNFASKEEVEALRAEVHELRIEKATVEKINGKLEQIHSTLLDRKRRAND